MMSRALGTVWEVRYKSPRHPSEENEMEVESDSKWNLEPSDKVGVSDNFVKVGSEFISGLRFYVC